MNRYGPTVLNYFELAIVLNLCYHPDFYYYDIRYTVVIPYATLSNSTVSLIIPPDLFTFKIYSRLSNSPALRIWYSRVCVERIFACSYI